MFKPQGLDDKVLLEITGMLTASLKNKLIFSVYVFGSRSKNSFKQYSDLDLWINADPQFSLRESTLLIEQFEASNIPIKVDIVTPESCLPDYRQKIDSEKKLWLAK